MSRFGGRGRSPADAPGSLGARRSYGGRGRDRGNGVVQRGGWARMKSRPGRGRDTVRDMGWGPQSQTSRLQSQVPRTAAITSTTTLHSSAPQVQGVPRAARLPENRQRFSHLLSTVKAPFYVLQCCANEAAGLSREETERLYWKHYKPLTRVLIQARAAQVRRLTLEYPVPQSLIHYIDPQFQPSLNEGSSNVVGPAQSRIDSTIDLVNELSLSPPDSSSQRWEHIRPGLMVLREALSRQTQDQLVRLAFDLATPADGRSAGWYYRNRCLPDNQQSQPRPRMAPCSQSQRKNERRTFRPEGPPGMSLTSGHYAMMLEKIQAFPPHFQQLCDELLASADAHATAIGAAPFPAMSPTVVLVNFYKAASKGLYWHRDNSPQERHSARRGSPVLSVSLGCDCDFEWKMEQDDEPQRITLCSGDVLVFGGPARMIHHAVTAIHPATDQPSDKSPAAQMPRAGRVNLTFRAWDR